MSILYTNIKKDNSLDFQSKYTPFSKKNLLIEFERNAKIAGIDKIEWTNEKESAYKCSLSSGMKEYKLFMYLRNISGAGWKEKPWIKRVQVPNIRLEHPEYYVDTVDNQTLVIIGYYNYDSNPLFVAWDAYGYVMHSTLRSCYVDVDDLLMGYKEDYYEGECANQKIWVFKPEHLCKFLDRYIIKNSL